ncbi:MAG: hypothetical protein WCV72_01590 [Patescibacteria group bacterium]
MNDLQNGDLREIGSDDIKSMEEIVKMRNELDLSAIYDGVEADKFRKTVFDKFKKFCPDETLLSKLFEKVEVLSNSNLERILALVANFHTAADFFANNDSLSSSRIATFLQNFDDDQLRMSFLISVAAGEKFNKLSFEAKQEIFSNAKTLPEFEKLVLDYKAEEDGSSGN